MGFETAPSPALVTGARPTPALTSHWVLAQTLGSPSPRLYLMHQLLGEVLELRAPVVQQPIRHAAV